MYQGASADGECPLVLDSSTPSCGDSRFGCWVCTVARSLTGIAQSVIIVKLPSVPAKGDVSDWLDAGGTRDQLLSLIEDAPVFCPLQDSPTIPKADEWDTIEPLGITNVPPFPVAALPRALADFVAAEAEATQTPPDLAAMLCLSTCAAAASKKVEVKVRDQWTEPVNLFSVTVLEPGNRKSAVFNHVTAPLREYEAQLIEQERPEIARLQARRRQRERQMKVLEEKAVKKGDADAAREAEEIAVELASTPEPVLPRLIVDDATSEKLGAMLAEQGGRIASMSPEGGVFDLMAGLYSKSGMPQFGVYLMGHAGDDLRVDRIGRKGEHVKRPALTMGLAIQPSVLEGLLENSAFRGRGLLARFLYSLPESRIGSRKIEPEPVSESIRLAYHNLIWNLCELPWDADQPQYICLADDAWALLREFMEKLEPELGSGGELDCTQDWGSKLAGAVARIAGILHCVAPCRRRALALSPGCCHDAVRHRDRSICHQACPCGIRGHAGGQRAQRCPVSLAVDRTPRQDGICQVRSPTAWQTAFQTGQRHRFAIGLANSASLYPIVFAYQTRPRTSDLPGL